LPIAIQYFTDLCINTNCTKHNTHSPYDQISLVYKFISMMVFTANHLTDTDKQNSTEKYTDEIQCELDVLFYNAPEPTVLVNSVVRDINRDQSWLFFTYQFFQ